ncbi:MAG: hypothetical protein HY880_08020 [Deltaproteobacteria bacterium]|nr:hypothetical protein [Deltaproteobacteria bacterium]
MGHGELIKALEEETLRQRAELFREAEEFSLTVSGRASLDAARERDEGIRLLNAELDSDRTVRLTIEVLRQRTLVLETKHEFIEEVLSLAVERLKGSEDYGRALKVFYEGLKAEWKKDGVDNDPSALVGPVDSGIVRDPDMRFVADTSVSNGVILVSGDGRIRYEATLSSRLKKARKRLVPIIASLLFED